MKKFKLKKDGECVGYMRIKGGDVEVQDPGSTEWMDQYEGEIDEYYGRGSTVKIIAFDSIHDFVCLDRNGKEVYEGDRVWDCRDDAIETMDERFWYRSLDCESDHVELIEEQP